MSFFKSNINIGVLLALLLAPVMTFTSCMKVIDDSPEAVGYLAPVSVSFDLSFEELTATKAESTIDISKIEELSGTIPELEYLYNNVHFVVKEKNEKGDEHYNKYGLWKDPLVLPVGEYTVEATLGTNDFGAPYFVDTASVAVISLEQVVPELSMEISNSLVKVNVSADLAEHFTAKGNVTLNGTHEVEYDKWTFVPSGERLTLSLTGVSSTGKEVTLTHTLSSPTSPKSAYTIICDKHDTNWPSITWPSKESFADGAFEDCLYFEPVNLAYMSDDNKGKLKYQIIGGAYSDWKDISVSDVQGSDGKVYKCISGLTNGETYSLRACVGNIVSEELSFSFTPVSFQNCFSVGSVTAAHNNAGNADVELSSTTMTVGSMTVNLPAIIEKVATVSASGSFSNSNSNNPATGSFLPVALSSTPKNASFTNAPGWPYLPQGTYSTTVTATCTINDASYTATATQKATVPAPVFKVLLSAYTSYDLYAGTNGNRESVEDANACDPGTIYKIGGGAKISVELLDNVNYGEKSFSITLYDGSNNRSHFAFKGYNSFETNYLEDTGNETGLSWQSYTLTSSMTFDGVTITKSNTHHITGLPYKKDLINDKDISGWSTSGSAKHYSKKGYLMWYRYFNDITSINYFTKPISLPSDASVRVSISAVFYAANTGLSHGKGTFHAGITSSTSQVDQTASTGSVETSNVAYDMSNANTACSNPINLTHTGEMKDGQMVSFSTSNQDGGKALGVYSVETGLFIAAANIYYNKVTSD